MRSGLMILGDHLPDPETGQRPSQREHHRSIVALAEFAEHAGLDSVWLGEHHFCDYILSSPPVLLGAIAERTERIRLGTAVTLLANLDPVRAAEDYATVDLLSDGRLELGVGRGILPNMYALFGQDPERSRELYAEKLELLLRLWSEQEVEWSGSARAPLPGVRVEPHPLQKPHPPVWVGGGTSNESIDLAARLGLRLMLPSVIAAPETFEPLVERYRERYLAAGHDPAGLQIGACSHVHIAKDSQQARRRWEPYHMGYFSWVVGLVDWAGAGFPGGAPSYDSLLAGPSICGSPAEVADRIGQMRERLQLDIHLAMFDHGGIPEPTLREALDLFASRVVPELQQASGGRSHT
jgi:alkanesulfonate monooxygenase SsuD/methylene tetrahydromethanopterin reductase-like flavin-dependent oxidoreductase (luciferase family)